MEELEKDYQYFVSNFKSITEGHIGEFVVIKDCKVIGYYKTTEDAIDDMRAHGIELGGYIVQECLNDINDNAAIYHSRVYLV